METSPKIGCYRSHKNSRPLPARRTFASILDTLGEDPGVVMDEMGHTDPALSLRVYRQSMRRGEDDKQALRALVEMTENRQ